MIRMCQNLTMPGGLSMPLSLKPFELIQQLYVCVTVYTLSAKCTEDNGTNRRICAFYLSSTVLKVY